MSVAAAGKRAVLLFAVLHSAIERFLLPAILILNTRNC
jgi:DNA-binding sugar fermentation-stimulating protein